MLEINQAGLSWETILKKKGNFRRAYLDGFKTLKLDFSHRHPAPKSVETSVAALKAWYAEMDRDLDATIAAFSNDDLANKVIDRGGGWMQPFPSLWTCTKKR